jgi:hypothetical protein
MHAAIEAQQHAESLGKINAQLRADSAAAPSAPIGNMHGTAAKTSSNDAAASTFPNAAAAHPHDARTSVNLLPPQCVATLFAQHTGSTMQHWPHLTTLPKQRQSVAQVLLIHAPHSVGILTASAASQGTPHSSATSADSTLQDVSCTVGVTLRAALTGSATAHAVLEQLVAALPSAVAVASKKQQRGGATGEAMGSSKSSWQSDAALGEGKRRLGALWLVLASVLRCYATEHNIKGASQALAAARLDLRSTAGSQIHAAECDTVSVQLERLALLTGSSSIAQESVENCPQGANAGGAGDSRGNAGDNPAQLGPKGLGVSAAVAVRWLQAQTEGRRVTGVATSEDSVRIVELAASVMQPLCESLQIATHETHALELLFSVLMFAEVCLR